MRMRLPMLMLTLCLSSLGCDRQRPQRPTPAVHANSPVAAAPIVGAHSCSGQACHSKLTSSEHTASNTSFMDWLNHDPHAHAYQALHGKLAQRMGKALGVDVTTDVRCLACHTTPQAASSDESWAKAERAYGVGCESCHGAGPRWLAAHRSELWTTLDRKSKHKEYDAHGMTWLPSLTMRAETCAGCHVGAPADPVRGIPHREVTHDFLAAGHPRLMFEFGAHHANLPKHWKEKDTAADFEARAWAVGQVACAQAALALLERNTRADAKPPWPELAHFDCYACHQGLDKSEGPAVDKNRGQRGSLTLAPWNLALSPATTNSLLSINAPQAIPWPSRESLHSFAHEASKELRPLAQKWEEASLTREDLKNLRQAIVRHAFRASPPNWDQFEQAALALTALEHADKTLREKASIPEAKNDAERAAAIERLLDALRFPKHHNSPSQFRDGLPDRKPLQPLLDTP